MSKIIEVRERLASFPKYPSGKFYALIVPDHAAGSPNRYTVYRIPLAPSHRIKVVGRELDLRCARKVAKEITDGD